MNTAQDPRLQKKGNFNTAQDERLHPQPKLKAYKVFAGEIAVMTVYAEDLETAHDKAVYQMGKSNRRRQYPGAIRVELR